MIHEEMMQSRRAFLASAGKIALGAAVAATVAPVANVVADETPAAPTHPFTYVKLDPEEVLKRGYQGYYDLNGCCAGAFDAIIGSLADKVGYPFNQIPNQMFANGATGYGSGSLCGALGGCNAAIALLLAKDDARKVTAELHAWYMDHQFPEYDPENYAAKKTVAKSVNCADSVSKFMKENNIGMKDPIRKARCGAVTGECARKTVELLNAHFNL